MHFGDFVKWFLPSSEKESTPKGIRSNRKGANSFILEYSILEGKKFFYFRVVLFSVRGAVSFLLV